MRNLQFRFYILLIPLFLNVSCNNSENYEGGFNNGQKHGKGKFTNEFGTYIGEFKNDSITGTGCYIANDGGWYKGQWKNKNWEGIGEAYWATTGEWTGDYCFGEFKNDELNGFAFYKFKNESTYLGWFVNGYHDGIGKSINMDPEYRGDTYIGNWSNGKRNGKGRYYYASVKKQVDGIFENDHLIEELSQDDHYFQIIEQKLKDKHFEIWQRMIAIKKQTE